MTDHAASDAAGRPSPIFPDIRYRHTVLIALACYLLVDFVYLPLAPTFPDEGRFIEEAVTLVETGEFRFGERRAWEMPLTAAWYALLYMVAGSKTGLIVAARIAQSGLLIGQALFLARISRLLFRADSTAFLTFVIALFYPYLVFYQGLLLSETLFDTFLIGGIYFLLRGHFVPASGQRDFVLSNGWLAGAVWTKGTLAALPPLLTAGFILITSRSWSKGWRHLALATAVFTLLLSPWWIRNYLVLGEPVWFTTSSAWVLYSGSNPLNQSGGGIIGVDVEVLGEAERLPELEWRNAYRDRALAFIADHPLQWIELAGRKFIRFWRIIPYAEGWNRGIYKWISLLSFGPILGCAMWAVVRYRKDWRNLFPLFALIAYFTAVHMVTITSLRYRLPLEPFLIVLAAPVLRSCWEWTAGRMRSLPPVGNR